MINQPLTPAKKYFLHALSGVLCLLLMACGDDTDDNSTPPEFTYVFQIVDEGG